MTPSILKRSALRAGILTFAVLAYVGCQNQESSSTSSSSSNQASAHQGYALAGDLVPPSHFSNPYAQVPAQCYIETASGTQNACLFCHTNGVWKTGMGNNNPQAGAFADIGNFQLEYSFAPYNNSTPLATINRWENTLYPEKLAAHVAGLGIDTNTWDMQSYLRQDNWSKAYAQRPKQDAYWDAGGDSPFRLLPALNPADLPAQADGFVRSQRDEAGFYRDAQGIMTGWRAINF
ncbi:MAG TPA: hypothetical protein PLU46_09895, partial [Thiotrichales bacterium]|nr:hypothetical protein [Thiotrichales bacterium]